MGFEHADGGVLIDGKWLDGAAGTFGVTSPGTGEVVHEVSRCDVHDVSAAVRSARSAQVGWANLSVIERVEILRRMAQLVHDHGEEIARMVTTETGKTIRETRAELY